MNKIIITLALFASTGIFMGCEQEASVIVRDELVPQPTDTVTYNSFYLENEKIINKDAFPEAANFGPISTYLDGTDLYVANFAAKRVDLFDVVTMTYKRSFSNGRTEARDIYVNGDHLFVGAGNMRELQIFDKNTGKYLTRLGNGVFSGSVSFASGVAATEQFVFIHDSKGNGIKVFDRSKINLVETANNNSPFSLLKNDGYTGNSNMNDLEVIDDSLYVFQHDKSTVYIYSIADVAAKKTDYVKKVTGLKIYSVSVDIPNNNIYVAMEVEKATVFRSYSLADFKEMKLNNPSWTLVSAGTSSIPTICNIAYHNQRLIFPRTSTLESWNIKNAPVHIITPRD